MNITVAQLKKIVPAMPKQAEVFVPHLNTTFTRYHIDTVNRVCMFIAQVAHESGGFKYTHELGGSAYFRKYDTGTIAAALGNTPEADGDGELYKGRGLIEVTGRDNYEACGKALGLDLIKHPELLEDPLYACLSAGWFWDLKKLNTYADLPATWRSKRGYTPFQYVTFLVNGGLNGYLSRENYYRRGLQVIK